MQMRYCDDGLWHALLAPYAGKSTRVMRCPSVKAEDRSSAWKSDYGWNYSGWSASGPYWGLGYLDFDSANQRGGAVRSVQIPAPSETLMLGDGRDRGNAADRAGDQYYGVIGFGSTSSYAPSLHDAGCDIAFVDGHARWIRRSELSAPAARNLWTRIR